MRPKLEAVNPVLENKVSADKGRDMDSEFKEAVGKGTLKRLTNSGRTVISQVKITSEV